MTNKSDLDYLIKLRVLIDNAITYNNLSRARQFAKAGLKMAQMLELMGEIMYFKAQLAVIDENYSEAIKLLDLAIEYNPNDGAAFNDRALCMVELGQIEGVLSFFDRGILVEPNFATIHHNRGWFLNQLGENNEALKSLRRALELDPTRAVTYENLADCLFKLGLITEAIVAYEQAISNLDPQYTQIRQQLQKLIKILKVLKAKKK